MQEFFKRAALVVALSGLAFAQESVNYGSVSGRVTDPSGGVVAGASVTARQLNTNQTTTATTTAKAASASRT